MSRLDPRSKLLMVLCISTLAIVWQGPLKLLYLLLFSILMLGWQKRNLLPDMQVLFKTLPLLGLLFLLQCIFVRQGIPLLTLHGINIVTDVGLNLGLSVMLRIVIIIISGMILLSSSERDFLLGLVQWRIPYEIAFMVMLGLHFVPILREEALNVFYAVQMRGTELKKTSLRQKLQLYTQMLLPMLSGAISRAEQMSIAMEARAFRACPQRSYMRKLKLQKQDYFVQIAAVLVCLILLLDLHLGEIIKEALLK